MIELIALVALLASFYIAWNIGSNDTANAMGTAIGANILTYRRAVALLIIFVALGAVLEGYKVMKPVGEKVVVGADPNASPFSIGNGPAIAAIAMLSAGIFVTLATKWGLPVSTHQAIIGALAGSGISMGTFSAIATHVNWSKFLTIIGAWIITPLAAGLLAFLLYKIFEVPIKRVKAPEKLNLIFIIAVIASGCYVGYVMGANDVGTAMGAMYATGSLGGASITQELALLGAVGVAVGSLTYSRNVMETVGGGITTLAPMTAFAAQLAAALTVHLFTQWGLPVSTSQAIVGGVAGAGLVRGMSAVSGRKMSRIVVAWISTPTVAMILAFSLTSSFLLV
jgi:PiT family inorganic phosphate transporter